MHGRGGGWREDEREELQNVSMRACTVHIWMTDFKEWPWNDIKMAQIKKPCTITNISIVLIFLPFSSRMGTSPFIIAYVYYPSSRWKDDIPCRPPLTSEDNSVTVSFAYRLNAIRVIMNDFLFTEFDFHPVRRCLVGHLLGWWRTKYAF